MNKCLRLLLGLLAVAMAETGLSADRAAEQISCQGNYDAHLQGVAADRSGGVLYWSFTRTLVATDLEGRVLAKRRVDYHHGDLAYADGKLYVAFADRFNDPDLHSRVYIYNAGDLSPMGAKHVPEVVYGAGGMECHEGRFFIVGDLPDDVQENYVYEYDSQFRFVKRHVMQSGHTPAGIQTACRAHGRWWFGCYGNIVLEADDQFRVLGKHRFHASLGILGWDKDAFMVGRSLGFGNDQRGRIDRASIARLTRTPADDSNAP